MLFLRLAVLLSFCALWSLVDASAIKGHLRAHEDARSIKLAPLTNNLDKAPKSAAPPNQPVPILESTKKIYNDETIRRLAQQQQLVEPVALVVAKEPQQANAAPKEEPANVALEKQQVNKEVALVAPPVEAKSDKIEKDKALGKPDELPAQSERSAQQTEPAAKAAELIEPLAIQPVAGAAQPEVIKKEANVKDEPLQAKKDDAAPIAPPAPQEPVIEVPAPDPGLVLSEPIDSTTKLLIDLDEHVQKFLPAEEQQQAAQPNKDQSLIAGVDYSPVSQAGAPVSVEKEPAVAGKSSGPLAPYSSSAEDPIVPPLPSLDGVEKASAASPNQVASASSGLGVVAAAAAPSQSLPTASVSPSATRQGGQHQNQQQVITQLLDQLDSLQNRIQDTINQLVARRRYVMSALLRPMGTYVRRVRTNLERLQNRVNQLQAAAVSVGGGGGNRPGGFVDAAAIETIRRRIDDISKRISDIVNRIRFSLTPTSAPLNSNGRK